jgi:hypothetical protein
MHFLLFALLGALALTVEARAGAGPWMPLSQRAARLLAQAGRGLAEERRSFRAPARTDDDDDYIHHEILGGITDADENDPAVINAARYAVSQLEATDDSDRALRLASVTDAKQQLVAGTNYYLTANVHKTSCPEGSPNAEDRDACVATHGQECSVKVVDQAGQETRYELIEDPSCTDKRIFLG